MRNAHVRSGNRPEEKDGMAMTYTITLTDEEETSLKRLLAWNLEDATMLDPQNRARKRIYEKLLESERQK